MPRRGRGSSASPRCSLEDEELPDPPAASGESNHLEARLAPRVPEWLWQPISTFAFLNAFLLPHLSEKCY